MRSFMTPDQIEASARKVLDDSGVTEAPVNPASIAIQNNVRVYVTRFADKAISGVFRRAADGNHEIYIDRDSPGTRARFTLAHELAHYFLHSKIKSSIVDKDVNLYRMSMGGEVEEKDLEIQANMFAAALLMPKDLVERYYKSTQDVSELAFIFQVSEEAMGWRLFNLGIAEPVAG